MNSSTPVNHFTLKPSDLSAIRLLAKNKEPKYTNHATEQTLVRDIFHSEVKYSRSKAHSSACADL